MDDTRPIGTVSDISEPKPTNTQSNQTHSSTNIYNIIIPTNVRIICIRLLCVSILLFIMYLIIYVYNEWTYYDSEYHDLRHILKHLKRINDTLPNGHITVT